MQIFLRLTEFVIFLPFIAGQLATQMQKEEDTNGEGDRYRRGAGRDTK